MKPASPEPHYLKSGAAFIIFHHEELINPHVPPEQRDPAIFSSSPAFLLDTTQSLKKRKGSAGASLPPPKHPRRKPRKVETISQNESESSTDDPLFNDTQSRQEVEG